MAICSEIRRVWSRHFGMRVNQFSSVQSLSHVRLFATPRMHHARPPCPSTTPGVHSDSRPSSQWCHPTISSSVVPFSSCPQSLPASESFPMSQPFTWGGQTTGVSALASFLPVKVKARQRLRFQQRNRETKAETHTKARERKICKICQRKELRH